MFDSNSHCIPASANLSALPLSARFCWWDCFSFLIFFFFIFSSSLLRINVFCCCYFSSRSAFNWISHAAADTLVVNMHVRDSHSFSTDFVSQFCFFFLFLIKSFGVRLNISCCFFFVRMRRRLRMFAEIRSPPFLNWQFSANGKLYHCHLSFLFIHQMAFVLECFFLIFFFILIFAYF